MDKKYIAIGSNIWEVISESDTYYEIKTRETYARIRKDLCFVRYGSSLFYFEGDIKINDSNIEIESEEEYQEYLNGFESEEID